MIFKDYYKILGLDNSKVSASEIKAAYREQAKLYHPDVNAKSSFSEERFKDINEINTLPGALSFYLWEATEKSFSTEVDELIELAFKRQRERENRVFSYEQNILAMASGNKLNK